MREIEGWKWRLLVAPLGVGLLFGFFVMKVILPKIGETNSQLKLVEEVKQKTKSVSERINYINSVDQRALLENESNVSAALMTDRSPYWLVLLVSRVGERFGYSLTSFRVSPVVVCEEVEGGKLEVTASIDLSGPRERYVDFLWMLESSLPIITVNDFKMRSGGEMSDIELLVSAYFLPKKQGSDLSKLSLKDLVLEAKEAELLLKLAGRQRIEGVEVSSPSGERVRYKRANPFVL